MDQCAHSLLQDADFWPDDASLAAGFPMATGGLAGACRPRVKDRLEGTGARGRLEGADAVLRWRSLWVSGAFEGSWHVQLEQEPKRHHTTHDANGKVPRQQPQPARQGTGAHLRLIK